MEILSFMFSLFMGFIAGYFASHLAVNQLNHDRRKLEKEMAGHIDDNDRQIVSLNHQIEELEEMVLSQDDVRNTDGDISNQNFKQIKEFMRQQIALNAQVDQALRVLQTITANPYQDSDDEALATVSTETEVIDE
jgi:tryptophan 2,3-dioxygenase